MSQGFYSRAISLSPPGHNSQSAATVNSSAHTEFAQLQVPFRRVHLSEDAGHVDLYDTSGPQVGTNLASVRTWYHI